MSGIWFRRWYRLKWVGLTACLALLVARVAPGNKIIVKNTEIWLINFCVIISHQPVGPGIEDDIWHNWKTTVANDPGFLPKYRSITRRAGSLMYISLPLQPFFLFMLIATLVLFCWLVRRYSPGHCQQCGYDLTGNESGTCPECGTAVSPESG